jgi:hypothetical protein
LTDGARGTGTVFAGLGTSGVFAGTADVALVVDEDDVRGDGAGADDEVDVGGGGGVSLASILCRETMDGLGPGSARCRLLELEAPDFGGRSGGATAPFDVGKGLFRDGGDGG